MKSPRFVLAMFLIAVPVAAMVGQKTTPTSSRTAAPRAAASPQKESHAPLTPQQLEVLSVEEQFRQARLRGDLKALDRILSDDYSGTNQNGHTRNKAETIELFKTFRLKSVKLESPTVIVHGDTAVVRGFQTESIKESPTPARLRFVRVYVKAEGGWRLLASEQIASLL